MAAAAAAAAAAASFLSSLKPPAAAAAAALSYPRSSSSSSLLSFSFSINRNRNRRSRIRFSSFKNENSEGDCPVPAEQQPINEFQSLSNSFPFSWASSDVVEYSSRLFATGACFALFVGLPVSWIGSLRPESEPIRLLFASAATGLFVVILAVVRMYLGWAYVGNRLLSATVEYEETGWYDGQIWVKTAEVLARDRLLGSFSVKPVLGRLKTTLVFLGTSLLMCIAILSNPDSHKTAFIPPEEPGGRAVAGVYNDESARNFEPDAFCGGDSIVP